MLLSTKTASRGLVMMDNGAGGDVMMLSVAVMKMVLVMTAMLTRR